jgi:hypothetical protein
MTLHMFLPRFCFSPLIDFMAFMTMETESSTFWLFVREHENEIEEVISLEALHWVLQKIAGQQASLSLDNVPAEFLKV